MSEAAVREVLLPGRGVGLVAARDIAPGETVLAERAALVGVSEAFRTTCCARCLAEPASGSGRINQDGRPPIVLAPCSGCARVLLCASGSECARNSSSDGGGHGAVGCAMERLMGGAVDDAAAMIDAITGDVDRERLRFLAACADLRVAHLRGDVTAGARLDSVRQLCPKEGSVREHAAMGRLQVMVERAALAALGALGVEMMGEEAVATAVRRVAGDAAENAALLAKEGCNAFGVMAKAGSDERAVRGGAVYAAASRVNHGCFPNVARFDNFDGGFDAGEFEPPEGGVPAVRPRHPSELRLVAIDRIGAGEEVLMSYLPVNEPVARRRRRIHHTFGFACRCARCELEVRWAAEDGAQTGDETVSYETSASAPARAGDVHAAEAEAAAEAALDAAEEKRLAGLSAAELARRADRLPPEYAMWFARNMCPDDACGGTLAPPHTTAMHMTCNYCGKRRTDEEFYAMLTGGG